MLDVYANQQVVVLTCAASLADALATCRVADLSERARFSLGFSGKCLISSLPAAAEVCTVRTYDNYTYQHTISIPIRRQVWVQSFHHILK